MKFKFTYQDCIHNVERQRAVDAPTCTDARASVTNELNQKLGKLNWEILADKFDNGDGHRPVPTFLDQRQAAGIE